MDLSFLVNHKIKNITTTTNVIGNYNYELTLDNGDIYEVIPNVGGCSCSQGDACVSGLDKLPLDNMITSVKVIDSKPDNWGYINEDVYQIFIFFHDERFDIDVDEANSDYYGGGISIDIKRVNND